MLLSPAKPKVQDQVIHPFHMGIMTAPQIIIRHESRLAMRDAQNSIKPQKMISEFEDALLRSHSPLCDYYRSYSCNSHDCFRKILFRCIRDRVQLRRFRTMSRVFRDLVNGYCAPEIFQELYMDARTPSSLDTQSLAAVAPLCRHLTIKVGYMQSSTSSEAPTLVNVRSAKRISTDSTSSLGASSSSFHPRDSSSMKSPVFARHSPTHHIELAQQWRNILFCFRQLQTLTLRVNGDPAWPGRTDVEDILITLRIAIGDAKLAKLHSICLAPIHAMGIIHLRWLGVGAFGDARTIRSGVWREIKTLDIRIQNPFATHKLTDAQGVMFKKILYDYLRSFSPSLEVLRFVWLGGDGPDPITLHFSAGLEGRPAVQWPRLKELRIGNIIRPRRTIRLAPRLVPMSQVKMLRTTRRDSSMDADDSSAWIDVTDPSNRSGEVDEDQETDIASSIYSQSPPRSEVSAWVGGISRSSRDLSFYLDLDGGRGR